MSVTGAFLVLFVTFHALMNGVALFWPTAYNVVCEFLGANWYALVGSLILALGFLLHIVYALWLTVQNRKARGAERYDVTSRPKQVEWSSKNMLVLGIVVLAFLALHLIQFWTKMQFAEIIGEHAVDCVSGAEVPPAAGTWFLEMAFSNGLFLAIYLVAFVALWFHLTHGFWSMFQSCGWSGKIWMDRLKKIGCIWTTVVMFLFAAEAIVFTVQAHRHYYTTNPALVEQYAEMYATYDGEADAPYFEAGKGSPCEAACQTPCAKACENACDTLCEGAKCANANCSDSQCNPAACNCPEGQCGQPGVCKESNCAGCPKSQTVNE